MGGKALQKQRVLIWGAGVQGEKVYQMLSQHNGYEVIAFGDNKKPLWGKKKYQKIIIGPDDLANLKGIECIFIASVAVNEITKQLKKFVDVPIFSDINDLLFQRMAIDISGSCNAKCKWCVTGRKNRQEKQCQIRYMPYTKFVKVYEHLFRSGIIGKSTDIMLYNWGEPFLNKDYVHIIEYLANQKQRFSVSTNASKVNLLEQKNAYKNCSIFIFSMPGFSQESYDRIHGFSFEKIKRNIEEICMNLKNTGFEGDGMLSYHVYKFNMHEIEQARKFSELLGLTFNPYYPYFAGNSMMEEYLEGKMTKPVIDAAEQELYLSHVKELLKKRPMDYRCFLENIICIDCDGKLSLCCASDDRCNDFSWNNIFDINSFEKLKSMRQKMLECDTCKKCRLLGIDYWMEYNPVYMERSVAK